MVLPGPFTATDPDGTTDFAWNILAGNDAGYFSIGETSGQLMVAKTGLNFEEKSEYLLFITAADPEGADDGRQINVTITDVNDPPTVPDRTYMIEELNATTGGVITTLEPSDEDGDDITYRVVSVMRKAPSPDGNYLTDTTFTRTPAHPDDFLLVELVDTANPNDGAAKDMRFTTTLTYDVAPEEGSAMYPFEYEGNLVRAVYEVTLEADDGTVRVEGKQMIVIQSDLSARDLLATPLLTGIQVCNGACSTDDRMEPAEDTMGGMLTRGTQGTHTQGVKIQALNLVDGAILEVTYQQAATPFLSYTAECMIKKTGDRDENSNDLDYLVCTVPPGVGAGFRWNVIMRGTRVATSINLETSYATPSVSGIVGPNSLTESLPMSTAGGQTIVLGGSNLGFAGMDLALVQVRYGFSSEMDDEMDPRDFEMLPFVGTVQSSGVQYDELRVTTGAGYGQQLSVYVRVGGQVSVVQAADMLEYAAPTVQGIAAPVGASHMLSTLDSAGG